MLIAFLAIFVFVFIALIVVIALVFIVFISRLYTLLLDLGDQFIDALNVFLFPLGDNQPHLRYERNVDIANEATFRR